MQELVYPGLNQIVRELQRQLIKRQSNTVITLLIMISAEALQILCSTTLIITREQERGFGMTAQGQVRRERKSGLDTMGEDRGERK